MSDTLIAGATWRRQITITDANGQPVDPTDITAVLCPETRMTVTQLAPGDYEISLTEAETAPLEAGQSHWNLWGRIGSDMALITNQSITVYTPCGP